MAKKRTSSPKVALSANGQCIALGVAIAFLSTVALFKWGIFGIVFTNVFRLLFGEVYGVVLLGMIAIGGYMAIRARVFQPSGRLVAGSLLILSGLTTLFHFNAFYDQEPLLNNIFVETFHVFQSDFLNNQTVANLGGGLLGAVYYISFGYLFGRWGTYLLVALMLASGSVLAANIPLQTLQQWSSQIGQWLKQGIQALFPKRTVTFTTDDTLEDVLTQESVVYYDAREEIDELPVPTKRKRRFLQQFIDVFNGDDDFDAEEVVLDEEVEILLEKDDVEEVFVPEVEDFEVETVLDLDDLAPPIVEVPRIEPIIEVSTPPIEWEEMDVAQSAGHWQAKAHEAQALTDDALEKALNQGEEPVIVAPIRKKTAHYQLPTKQLLTKIPPVDQSEEYERINENIKKLEQTFESFGVKATVVKANLGPSVTKYEIQPAIGVKVSKIVSLSDDIALALAARDVRMEAPIPGKSLIGIEVPNTQVSPVSFWEIIDAALESPNVLEVPLGRDISGTVCLADLSKMPHLLIAGATGSGKSVGMNVIIVSLLMKAKPEEVKFLMIDPKKVELTMYDDIPHLLAPVVTNPRKAAQALNKVVQEMERRYELFATTGVRNIDSYNEQIDQHNRQQGTGYERLPKIVVFVDELADLMMVASNEVENAIIRLAQMARAAGIHMIIATQRPSVDVITGIIKANVPSRLAFAVSSGIDSRTILDSNGAEKLLGRGDMLFQPMGKNKPVRVQGAYISDSEVERITDFVKAQRGAEYDENMIVSDSDNEGFGSSDDEYFDEAVEMVRGLETISISQLQRRFRIGYNRAARLIDDMEAQGIVSGQDGSKPRQVLISNE